MNRWLLVALLPLGSLAVAVWQSEPLVWKDVFEQHVLAYTAFRFKEIPAFLKDALAKPKP